MQINLQAKNIEITPAIHDYVVKKVTNLGKILSKIEKKGGEVQIFFEVGKSSKHHKGGEYFHSDCSISMAGQNYYASADEEDLYQAIDTVKDSLFYKISKNKDKKISLFYRGARKIKNTLKGLTSWKK